MDSDNLSGSVLAEFQPSVMKIVVMVSKNKNPVFAEFAREGTANAHRCKFGPARFLG
jgi:hypothetical protein